MERYNRNRIYVSEDEQEKVRETRILLGGAGIGSIIAECALRFGFENIVIVDGDRVELSNLNRQNYVKSDIGKSKAECLAKRLLRINPKANIQYHDTFIDKGNVKELLEGVDIAINALDFKSDIPFVFDDLCSKRRIPVLHPYNFGWGAFLTIIKPGGYQLTEVSPNQPMSRSIGDSILYAVKCVAGTAGSAGLGFLAGAGVGTVTLPIVGTVSGGALGGWSGALVGVA